MNKILKYESNSGWPHETMYYDLYLNFNKTLVCVLIRPLDGVSRGIWSIHIYTDNPTVLLSQIDRIAHNKVDKRLIDMLKLEWVCLE